MEELTSPKSGKEPSTKLTSPEGLDPNKVKQIFDKQEPQNEEETAKQKLALTEPNEQQEIEEENKEKKSNKAPKKQNKIRSKSMADSKLFQNGWEATQVLKKNTGNPRYLGFSTFYSDNVLQNSSYMYSFPKGNRFDKLKEDKSHFYYHLPMLKNERFTTMGYGHKKTVTSIYGKGCPSPDRYTLKTSVDYNLFHKKGAVFLEKFGEHKPNNLKNPGPGTYNLSKYFLKINMPIKIKSRQVMFYDDDLKKRAHCVSMEKYHPKYTLTEPSRFGKITFGIGLRQDPPDSRKKYPGPGSYHVKSCFETGYKKKWPIN